jgi:DNA-binding transcriptional ArsR family regulator
MIPPENHFEDEELTPVTQMPFFLHKEVPLGWIIRLLSMSKSAIRVGLALTYRKVLTKKSSVTLPKGFLQGFGISPDQKRRGLRELRDEGLVEYEVLPGRNPRVHMNLKHES